MTNRPVSVIAGPLLVAGAIWLAWFVWDTSPLPYPAYGPPITGAFVAALTIGAVVDRRPIASALVVTACALAIITLVSIAVAPPIWVLVSETSASASYYASVAGGALAAAIAGASIPRRRRSTEHRLFWLWISALLTLGAMGLLILATDEGRGKVRSGPLFVVGMLLAPVIAGALTQLLARRRMIWTCGGGAAIFLLLLVEHTLRERDRSIGDLIGVIAGLGIFVVLGALGARIAWRIFRNTDPRDPPPASLPSARI